MKKALILTYFFPPANSVAAFRAWSWAKHFKKHGIYPVIITRHWAGNENGWNDLLVHHEGDLSHEKYDDYEVFRLPSSKLPILRFFGKSLMKFNIFSKAMYFFLHYFGYLNIITDGDSSFRPFLKKHLQNNHYDVIIATSPPLNLIRLAAYLHKKFKIPFVIDHRDLWNNDYLKEDYQPGGLWGFLEKRTLYWLKKWLKDALFCSTVSQPIADKLGIVFEQQREVVQNGYDDDIFKVLVKEQQSHFSIALSGTYYPQQDLNLMIDGLLLFLKGKSPDEVKISFIGLTANGVVSDLFKKKIPEEFTEWTDRVAMKQAMQKVKNAHVLLHSGWKGYKGVYTTKLFDYVASGNNILLAPGDYDVMDDLINETGTGKIADSPESFAFIMNQWLEDWKAGEIPYHGNENRNKYSRSYQAENMASKLNLALDKRLLTDKEQGKS